MFEKSNQQSHAAFYVGCLFVSQGMDAYKHNVMVEIKKVPIFMWCLFCVGTHYPDFMIL